MAWTQPLWTPSDVVPYTDHTAPVTPIVWAASGILRLEWPRIATGGRDQGYGREARDAQFGQNVSHSSLLLAKCANGREQSRGIYNKQRVASHGHTYYWIGQEY